MTLSIGDIFRSFTCLFSSSADRGGPARRAPRAFEQDPGDATSARHASGPPEASVEVRSQRLYGGRHSLGDGARSIQCGQSVADRLWVAQRTFAFPSFLRGFADGLAVPQKWEFQARGGGDVMKNVSSGSFLALEDM